MGCVYEAGALRLGLIGFVLETLPLLSVNLMSPCGDIKDAK